MRNSWGIGSHDLMSERLAPGGGSVMLETRGPTMNECNSGREHKQVSWRDRLGRAALGLGLGWICSSLIAVFWFVLVEPAFGLRDNSSPKTDRDLLRASLLAGGPIGAMAASWIGCIVGAAALGVVGRGRNAVLISTSVGGGCGAVLGTAFGLLFAWAGWEY